METKVLVTMQSTLGIIDVRLDRTFDDMGLDSLDRLEVVMDIEQQFNIDIPDRDTDTWTTPKDIVHYLQRRGA